MVCYHLIKFDGHSYCSNRDVFLVGHTIKQDHVVKGSDDYNDRNPSK